MTNKGNKCDSASFYWASLRKYLKTHGENTVEKREKAAEKQRAREREMEREREKKAKLAREMAEAERRAEELALKFNVRIFIY